MKRGGEGVLQLGPFPPPHGGVQTNLVAIRSTLTKLGWPNYVINLTRHRAEERDGVFYPSSGGEVLRRVRSLPVRILHLHIGGVPPVRLFLLALLCGWMPGRKSLLTFHSGGYASMPEGQAASWWNWRGFVFRQLDRIIVVNREMADMFERFGVRPERIRLILPHNPDVVVSEGPLPEPMASFYAAHDPVLVTVSGLEPEYDIPLQIEAMAEIRRRHPRAGLVVIGGGSQAEEVERLRVSKEYAPHVLLCADVPHELTLRAVARATVFLRTTHYDGDAVSVREALAIGGPVVATDNGMRPPGCYLFPPRDRVALEETVERALREGPLTGAPKESEGDPLAELLAVYEELLRR